MQNKNNQMCAYHKRLVSEPLRLISYVCWEESWRLQKLCCYHFQSRLRSLLHLRHFHLILFLSDLYPHHCFHACLHLHMCLLRDWYLQNYSFSYANRKCFQFKSKRFNIGIFSIGLKDS